MSTDAVADERYTASAERVVAAPPAAIFALLADPTRHPDLDGSGTVMGVVTSPGPLSVGSTFDMHMKRGFSYSTRNTVLGLEPERLISWSTRPLTFPLSLLIGGRIWTYRLSPVDGGTRVTETWDLRPERNRALVARLAGDPAADMRATLERIAELVAD